MQEPRPKTTSSECQTSLAPGTEEPLAARMEVGASFFTHETLGKPPASEAHAILWIEPQSFLTLAKPGVSASKLAKAEFILGGEGKFHHLPYLMLDPAPNASFRVSGHEGRHRVRALMSRGVTLVPIEFRFLGWKGRGLPPVHTPLGPVISENGATALHIPFHVHPHSK